MFPFVVLRDIVGVFRKEHDAAGHVRNSPPQADAAISVRAVLRDEFGSRSVLCHHTQRQ